jgi:uncharacterized Tic20 family protein
MANWYYYDNKGQKQGPITSAQLQTLVINKIITPATRIVTEDGRETTAGLINGLFSTPPPVTPVAVPVLDTPTETITPQTVIFCSGMDSNILFMFMHLCGLLFFPMMIFLWVVAKDPNRANVHGKTILNWYLSAAVYMVGWLLVSIIVAFLSFIIIEATGLGQIAGIALSILALCRLCLLVFAILLTIFPIRQRAKIT